MALPGRFDQPQAEGWWGGRIFSNETKKADSGKTGIVYYDSCVSQFFMKLFSIDVTVDGVTYQINRQSAQKFFQSVEELQKNPYSDELLVNKILEHYTKRKQAAISQTPPHSSPPQPQSSSPSQSRENLGEAIIEGEEEDYDDYYVDDYVDYDAYDEAGDFSDDARYGEYAEDLIIMDIDDPFRPGGKATKTCPETLACIDTLTQFLEKSGEKLGTADDTGDCFFDAVAQELVYAGIDPEASVKTLRKDVKEYVDSLPSKNWVQKFCGHHDALETYESYKNNVGKAFTDIESEYYSAQEKNRPLQIELNKIRQQINEQRQKIRTIRDALVAEMDDDKIQALFSQEEKAIKIIEPLEKELQKKGRGIIPYASIVWGSEMRDGRILAEKYKVNIQVCLMKGSDEEPCWITVPPSKEYERTIKIALYPGHYVPIWPK